MNDLYIYKVCSQTFYASRAIPTTLKSFLYGIFYLFALFQPDLLLNAYEVDQVPNQIIVKYKDPSFSPLAINSTHKNQKGIPEIYNAYNINSVFQDRIDVILIEGDNISHLIDELKKDPGIEYIEPHFVKQIYGISVQRDDIPNDIDFGRQWSLNSSDYFSGAGIDFIKAISLSNKNTLEEPVIIGIIDSTFDINHPDLINQLWVNEEEIPNNGIDDDNNGYIDDIHGFNFENLTSNLSGSDDHGTHVAGISVAENNNGIGISGVFPRVKFIALSCSSGDDSISLIATLRAKEYLLGLKNRGYNIVAVNASYGGNYYSQAEYEGIQSLANAGIIFCTAAGNDGWDLDLETSSNGIAPGNQNIDLNNNGILEVSYPNSYDIPNIIGVASINSNQELATDSNYGNNQVDIAAPGVSIYSTISLNYTQGNHEISLNDGTSIANQLIENSSSISVDSLSGQLIYCGIGLTEQFPNEVIGNIALIQRGSLFFSDKVLNAMNAGAIATIIFNNVEENSNGLRPWILDGMLNEPWIPSFSISQADGENLLQSLPLNVTIKPLLNDMPSDSTQYAYFSGTSMAAPVVTAAVAFAAHNFPNEDITQRRNRIINNVKTIPNLTNKLVSGGVVNLLKIIDTDEDTLPDWWEMNYFSTLAKTNTQDIDNDGYSNREEFISGTNPTNADNRPSFRTNLKVSNLSSTSFDSMNFEFIMYPGYTYQIQSIDSISENTWNNINHGNLIGDGIPMKVTIDNLAQGNKGRQFYRIQASPE